MYWLFDSLYRVLATLEIHSRHNLHIEALENPVVQKYCVFCCLLCGTASDQPPPRAHIRWHYKLYTYIHTYIYTYIYMYIYIHIHTIYTIYPTYNIPHEIFIYT